MSIESISQFGGLYSAYPVREIPVVSTQQVQDEKRLNAEPNLPETLTGVESASSQSINPVSRKADLQNLSLTFNTGDDYAYIGKDRALENLDVKRAVSDMQKDSVLQQYQTFVGDSNMVFRSDDGVVLMK